MMKFGTTALILAMCGLTLGCDGDTSKKTDASAKSTAEGSAAPKGDTKEAKKIAYDESKAHEMMKSLEEDASKASDVIPKLAAMGPEAAKRAKFQVLDLAAKAGSMEEQKDQAAADAADKAAVLLVQGLLKTDAAHLEDIAKNTEVERPLVRAAVCVALKDLGKDCPAKS